MKLKLPRSGILENIGSLLAGTAFARVLSALSVIIISRRLGPDLFGQYAASLSVVRLSSVLFSLGLDSWLLRSGGREQQRVGDLAVASVVLKIVLGTGWIIVVVMFAPVLNQDTFSSPLLLLAALSVWFEEIVRIGWSTFKAALKNRVTLLLTVGSEALLLLVTLAVAEFYVDKPQAYLLGRAIAFFITGGVSVVLIVFVFRSRFYIRTALFALKDTLPFGVSVALATIYRQADVAIVAHWLDKTSAGLYSPAISLASAFFLIPAAIYGVMLPVLSQHYASDIQKARALSMKLLKWVIVLAVLLGSGLAIIARPLVQVIYGDEFALSGDVLTILGGVLAFRSISFGLGAILAAVGLQSRRVVVQAVAAFVNVGLNLLVVRSAGILGVAKVYVFSEAILMLGYSVLVWDWIRKAALTGSSIQS